MSFFEDWSLKRLLDIATKIVSVAKFLIPGVAMFYFLKAMFIMTWVTLGNWFSEKATYILGEINAYLLTIGIDLTPPPAFVSFIAKANTVVPLDESWRLLLLFLGFAAIVIAVKWLRNLIPGIS